MKIEKCKRLDNLMGEIEYLRHKFTLFCVDQVNYLNLSTMSCCY